MVKGKQITIAFHVDDLLVTSESDEAIQQLTTFLQSRFTAVNAELGDKYSYLAITIERKKSHYTVSMDGYITMLLSDRKLRDVASPANYKLFDEKYAPEYLSDSDQRSFHSHVAKLLFLAKHVKMSCLTAVSALASSLLSSTSEDRKKLDKVFSYVASSRAQIMKFKIHGEIHPVAFVDASYAAQSGGKSRTGILLKSYIK